jgi:plasmid stabilization system protein ParE
MTTPRVVLSRSARADLLEIETFIDENSGEHRAEAVIGRLLSTLRTLSFRPGIGRSRSYTERGELAFPVERWMVIYEPLPDLEGIRVLRVIDGRRDLDNLLS